MKAINFADRVIQDAEEVAGVLGMSAERLIKQSVEAMIHDLKEQVEYLATRAERAEAKPAPGDKALALLEEGIPDGMRDAEINQQGLAALIKKQKTLRAYQEKLVGEVMGFQVNH